MHRKAVQCFTLCCCIVCAEIRTEFGQSIHSILRFTCFTTASIQSIIARLCESCGCFRQSCLLLHCCADIRTEFGQCIHSILRFTCLTTSSISVHRRIHMKVVDALATLPICRKNELGKHVHNCIHHHLATALTAEHTGDRNVAFACRSCSSIAGTQNKHRVYSRCSAASAEVVWPATCRYDMTRPSLNSTSVNMCRSLYSQQSMAMT